MELRGNTSTEKSTSKWRRLQVTLFDQRMCLFEFETSRMFHVPIGSILEISLSGEGVRDEKVDRDTVESPQEISALIIERDRSEWKLLFDNLKDRTLWVIAVEGICRAYFVPTIPAEIWSSLLHGTFVQPLPTTSSIIEYRNSPSGVLSWAVTKEKSSVTVQFGEEVFSWNGQQ